MTDITQSRLSFLQVIYYFAKLFRVCVPIHCAKWAQVYASLTDDIDRGMGCTFKKA
ncbi:hypothetical protein ACIPT2_09840 [Pectobacterium brasiliense]